MTVICAGRCVFALQVRCTSDSRRARGQSSWDAPREGGQALEDGMYQKACTVVLRCRWIAVRSPPMGMAHTYVSDPSSGSGPDAGKSRTQRREN